MDIPTEPVADAAMDAKMRELWGKFERPWVRNMIRESLPPMRVHSLGCDFIVHPKDNFTEFKMWENGLPPEHIATQEIAERLADTDATIVDVGGNAGAFFLPILKAAGPKARAVVFEPNPVMQARLMTNVDLNELDDRVELFNCAVGDSESTSKMYFPRNGNLGQGRVNLQYDHKAATEGDEVAIRPLATCLAEAGIDHVDFLKVDVEGLEDRVICPLLQAQGAPMPRLIYFEVAHDGSWHYPLLDVLAEKGYNQIETYGMNSLFERPADA
jgi:FkbM family methyltransferase